MNSILHELWYGNVRPQDAGMCDTPEIQEHLRYLIRHRENLERTLSEEQKELFVKYTECWNEQEGLCEAAIFAYGFRLGAKIILDIMVDTKK